MEWKYFAHRPVREIAAELEGVSGDRPLTETEVATARNAELSVFPEAFETPARIAGSLAQLAIYHLPDNYFAEYAARLAATNLDEVTQVMTELTARRGVTMLVVGDRQKVEPQLQPAGFTRVRYVDTDGQSVGARRDVQADGKK